VDLCLHHCFSDEPFTKDKFEYAVVRITKACGGRAEKARAGLRGHDVTVNDVRVSLKTEAAASTKLDEIHISKFMELGKGEWGNKEAHLHEKRDQFLGHLRGYDRIFTLRCLSQRGDKTWKYELVEIPKALLMRANNGVFTMMHESSQRTAIPGYCRVYDDRDRRIFELYFDGGGERKLQIKHLLKSHCAVIATWEFLRDS
jgi:type II restriction enzyme